MTLRIDKWNTLLAGILATLPSTGMAEFIVSKDWWGSLGYTYRSAVYDTGSSEVQNQVTTNINNRFYLWQNWLATGETHLNLSHDKTDGSDYDKENNAVTGSAQLNLLPLSKIPLSLGYALSDNRIYADPYVPAVTGTYYSPDDHIVSRQYFITQSYIGDRFKVKASHIHDSQDSAQLGLYSTDINSADLIWREKYNDVLAKYYEKKESRELNNEDRESTVATINHNYYPNNQFSTSTFGSHVSQDEFRFDDNSANNMIYLTDINQLSSMFIWRSLSGKTNLTGGLRYFDIETENPSAQTQSDSLNGNLHYTYRLSTNLIATASTIHTVTNDTQDSHNSSSQRLGISYTSDAFEFDQYSYTWYSNAQTGRKTEDDIITRENIAATGHTLFRGWNLSRVNSLRLSLNQSIAALYEDDDLEQKDLSHNITFGWNSNTETSSSHAQISLSDRRNLANNDDKNQLITVQISQRNRLNRRFSITGNLTHQYSNYEYAETDTEARHTNSSALLRAEYVRPFSFQHVTVTSDIKYIHNDVETSEITRNDFSWDSRLRHTIGKLENSLRFLYRSTDDYRYRVVYFNIKRHF